MLRERLATAAVAIPFLVWLVFFAPPWAFPVVVLAIAVVGVAEYFHMAFPGRAGLQASGIAGGVLVGLGMAHAAGAVASPGAIGIAFPAALFAIVVMGLLGSLLDPDDPAGTVVHIGHGLLGILYAGALLPHFVWLHRIPDGPAWVLFVLAVAMAGDTGGYFAGRFYGKRKLMPRVSPKKTVEGAIGAFAGNAVAGLAVKALLLPSIGWLEIVLVALVAGLLAQLGDLCESLLKRAFGAKDSGRLLPGHGGVLDRADSLVFPVVFVYYWLTLLRGAV